MFSLCMTCHVSLHARLQLISQNLSSRHSSKILLSLFVAATQTRCLSFIFLSLLYYSCYIKMGQRHQVYVAFGRRYRIGIHHQWLYGRTAVLQVCTSICRVCNITILLSYNSCHLHQRRHITSLTFNRSFE